MHGRLIGASLIFSSIGFGQPASASPHEIVRIEGWFTVSLVAADRVQESFIRVPAEIDHDLRRRGGGPATSMSSVTWESDPERIVARWTGRTVYGDVHDLWFGQPKFFEVSRQIGIRVSAGQFDQPP